jgi:hypothetical protein
MVGCAAFCCAGSSAPAGELDVLYDNGPFVTALNGCTFFDPAARSTPQAPSTTLGLQIDAQVQRIFDDFEIPAGQAWDLSRVRWLMYQPNAPVAAQVDEAYLRLWLSDPRAGGKALVGDLTTNLHIATLLADAHRTGPADPQSCVRMIKSVEIDAAWLPILPAGHYWIEVGMRSSIVAGPFANPTEPRHPTDNAGMIQLSGAASDALDEGSGLPLDFPFVVTGSIVPDPLRACVLPAGTCQNSTFGNCTGPLGGTWNYLHSCAELGACCNSADGLCRNLTAPEDCSKPTESLSPGTACSSIPACGRVRGACCFPNDQPVDCQSLVRGIDCAAQGGQWHAGHCSTVMCHDFCETIAPAFDGDQPFITVGATTDGPQAGEECGYDPLVGGNDIWFRYQSTLSQPNGSIAISLCNNDGYDATLQVYRADSGTTCADLPATALSESCDNDGCGAAQGPARLTVDAGPNEEFWIRIGGYAGDHGAGQMTILPIEAGSGACCLPDTTCAILTAAACSTAGGGFRAGQDCFNPAQTCGPIGACCAGALGCSTTTQVACSAHSGTFVGAGTACGVASDCDGNGETDFCALFQGEVDCNSNGVPDACDIDPVNGTATDCDGNLVPDECDEPQLCCAADTHHDGIIDGQDAAGLTSALLAGPADCLTVSFCRADANSDHRINGEDIAAFISRMRTSPECAPVLHISAQVLPPGSSVRNNQVFICDASGKVLRQYTQISPANTDTLGYRDGASDGTHVYFGWIGGVARHEADGSGGEQIIFGPVPGTGGTWRALAFDPTGDGGNGSFWTQSFNSDLVETDLAGNLLHQFPNNGSLLYGMAYDNVTGRLWGHHQSETTASAHVVEIDPETGLLTGVVFPSHFNVPGGSIDGRALHGGLSMHHASHTLLGVLQATRDALFSCDTSGGLTAPVTPNPRLDLQTQMGTSTILGVAVVQP